MKSMTVFTILGISIWLSSCADEQENKEQADAVSDNNAFQGIEKPASVSAGPSDPQATPQAAALFRNLRQFAGRGVLCGHQETLAYGIGWRDHEFDSDLYRTCGDFPAVFGWDLGEIGSDKNIDHVPFDRIKGWIRQVYEKNGINTFSWHMRNPATGGNSWDTTPAVARLIPGGDLHQKYLEKLDLAAEFLDIKGPRGEAIPIILRFFHEQNGRWFWWSAQSCNADEFKNLWRFTVDYFRNEKQMHQFLFAYSPDAFRTPEEYLRTYPGDEYVDILAMDNYVAFQNDKRLDWAVEMLETLAVLAEEKNKIAALTETGVNKMPDPDWFQEVLLKALKASDRTRRIAWVLLWRNESTRHFFSTYPDHTNAEGFRKFKEDPFTVFLSDLPDMYK